MDSQDGTGKGSEFDLRAEWRALARTASTLDLQTVVVLIFAALAVILQMKFGARAYFRNTVSPLLGLEPTGLASWTWWFGVQGVLGFLIPVLILRLVFRQKPAEMGLGGGDWRFAGLVAAVYVPLALVGTWILSDGSEFQAHYPHYSPAATDWSVFAVYEIVFLFYWMGWEYLWRGFVLFGTARTFGVYAVIIQTVPFAILHYDKPFAEAVLAIVGGLCLGALVWRSRSFWIAVPIHAVQMLLIDLFCSLRVRTGVTGIGLQAISDLLSRH